jgi:hypothetical protein
VARPLFPSESVASQGDGLVVVMLWIALAVVWLLGPIGDRCFRLRLGWVDWVVAVLMVCLATSALWAARHGAPRPALNMLWEWVGLGLSFFMVRQLVWRPREVRALLAVMIGLAVALAAHGLYQYFYELPRLAWLFHQDAARLLEEAHLAIEPGTPQWQVFVKRLEAREPLATFALTNSLAGFLAPWLTVVLGIAAANLLGPRSVAGTRDDRAALSADGTAPPRRWPTIVACVLAALPLATCLLLTKSRSAYAAMALGVVLVAICCRSRAGGAVWKMAAVVAVAAVLLVVLVTQVGGLDIQVLTETFKSLGYRAQYWQATLAMIADHPILGVGPGQFQSWYTAYKLPVSSEEISDPHNFLLEIWSTAGTPALVALLAILGLAGYAWWRTRSKSAWVESDPDGQAGDVGHFFILAGGAAGFLLSRPLGLMAEAPPGIAPILLGLPVAALTVALLFRWVRDGQMPALLPAVAVVVLLVNFLAAGGFAIPGVAGSFWLLLGLSLATVQADRPRTTRPVVAYAMLAAGLVLAFACYKTAYGPVTASRAALHKVQDEPQQAWKHYAEAAVADPLASEPLSHLAALSFAAWKERPDSRGFLAFERTLQAALARAPRSWPLWQKAGQWCHEAHNLTAQREQLSAAVDAYRRAVDLYPSLAANHARLALALHEAGDVAAAKREAAEARRLDAATPHDDKKLPQGLRDSLDRTIALNG